MTGESSSTFLGCEFVSNHGILSHDNVSRGGAIFTFHGSLTPNATTTITECSFFGNASGAGGAIHSTGGSTHVSSSLFVDNRSGAFPDVGGAGGAIYSRAGERRIVGRLFDRNASLGVGNAIYFTDGAQVLIEGSTFARHYSFDKEGNEWSGGSVIAMGVLEWLAESVEIRRSLIATNLGLALSASPGSFITISCTDIFGNGLGDWVGPIFGMDQEDGNLWLDPMFCGLEVGDLTLARQSPCLPANSSCGILIGALEEGCAPVALRPESWGRIKAAYRGGDTIPSSVE